MIYLDHHSTTPLDPVVLEEMMPYMTERFGNPSSMDHSYGYDASVAVEEARGRVAALVGARHDEIIFTSGATESDNLALVGVARRYADRGDHIITCATEHKAVLDTAAYLERTGRRVTYVPVDRFGMVDMDILEGAITPQTVLVSVMAANNEVGTIPDIRFDSQLAVGCPPACLRPNLGHSG
ncbi:MAG: aminotransferase class V-fold PLP-dependent enzyme, partial [Thaumarchaeota archaeon]|nr:aminotransferase class V-fold PLP-dependent enzyme [Nitrososphaerota archaeon]